MITLLMLVFLIFSISLVLYGGYSLFHYKNQTWFGLVKALFLCVIGTIWTIALLNEEYIQNILF